MFDYRVGTQKISTINAISLRLSYFCIFLSILVTCQILVFSNVSMCPALNYVHLYYVVKVYHKESSSRGGGGCVRTLGGGAGAATARGAATRARVVLARPAECAARRRSRARCELHHRVAPVQPRRLNLKLFFCKLIYQTT